MEFVPHVPGTLPRGRGAGACVPETAAPSSRGHAGWTGWTAAGPGGLLAAVSVIK